VAIICTTDAHWRHLCGAMGRPDLGVDPRYETHTERAALMDEVDGVVAAWTATRSRDEVWDACRAHHVPAAPVRDLNETLADAHLHERGYLVALDHPELGPVRLPRSALRFAGSALRPLTPSPGLGEHTSEVLGEWLGLSPTEVEGLRARGAL
jgi:formyl-CoA transferase